MCSAENKIIKLTKSALDGDLRATARLISLMESGSPDTAAIIKAVYPKSGRARIIGITGSPGAGKSTLVDKLISGFKAQGKSVGIIAVDPSSPFSGGAILGDRLRMQDHALDKDVYIRSMGARGSLGGVSSATQEAALLLDACGKDVIIIETVGVGQSEVDIVKIADTVCLILVPGMGDDVQIMKAGIMEIADVFIVNKSDKDGAQKVVTDVNSMLDLSAALAARDWRPPVVKTQGDKAIGIDEAIEAIDKHGEYLRTSDEGKKRQLLRAENEIERVIRNAIARRAENLWQKKKDMGILEEIINKRTDPYTVAGELMG